MKKITLLFLLLAQLVISQQFEIIEYNYDSNGCIASVDVEFDLNSSQIVSCGSTSAYVLEILDLSDLSNPNIDYMNFPTSTFTTAGTYTIENIQINGITKTLRFKSRSRSFCRYRTVWSTEIIACQDDFDSDGIPNEDDACIHEGGNAANFGCYGNPDVIVNDESIIASPGWGVDPMNAASNSNRVQLARNDGFIDFWEMSISNIGNGSNNTGNQVKVKFYISTDSAISSDDFTRSSWELYFHVPSPGQSTPINIQSPSIKIYGSEIGNNLSYGNYYFILSVDEDNDLLGSELNTGNNQYVLPIQYKASVFGRFSKIGSDTTSFDSVDSYSLDIYDFSGTLIKSEKVSNDKQESRILNMLPSGFYIVKTPKGTKKIVK